MMFARRRQDEARREQSAHEAAKQESRAEAVKATLADTKGEDNGILDSGTKQDSADPGLRGEDSSGRERDLQQDSKRPTNKRPNR